MYGIVFVMYHICNLEFYRESIYLKFGVNRMASKRRYMLAGITGGKIVSLFDPYPPVVSITRSGYPFCEWLLGDL